MESAEDFDLKDPNFIYGFLDEAGEVTTKKSVSNKTKLIERKKTEKETKVCDLYKKGLPVPDIILKTNTPETTVFNILRKNKIELRKGRSISKQREDKVVALYNDNSTTIKGIMKKTGIKSEQTIYRILKERKVILKSK